VHADIGTVDHRRNALPPEQSQRHIDDLHVSL
jgi:hypothetical protein